MRIVGQIQFCRGCVIYLIIFLKEVEWLKKNPRENSENSPGIPREFHGKTPGKPWENPGKTLSVCLSVHVFNVFDPTSRSRMSNIFIDLESLGKCNGKKWFQI